MPTLSPDRPSTLASPASHVRRFDPLSVTVFAALLAVLALLASGLGGRAVTAVTDAVGLSSAGQTSSATLSAARSSATGGAAAPAAAPAAKKISVMIQEYAYSPTKLSVKAGDTVTWTNMDKAAHTVTSSSGPEKLDSPLLQKGASWSHTFTKAGVVSYYCAVHPDMKATVTVAGSSGGHGGMAPSKPSACDPSLVSSVADPFWTHFKKGHLEMSPGQQGAEILNADQWAKTHTALFESMLDGAATGASTHAADGAGTFWTHVQKGHLETSPGQQATDITNVDGYAKTHTVLFETMLQPYMAMLLGTC